MTFNKEKKVPKKRKSRRDLYRTAYSFLCIYIHGVAIANHINPMINNIDPMPNITGFSNANAAIAKNIPIIIDILAI